METESLLGSRNQANLPNVTHSTPSSSSVRQSGPSVNYVDLHDDFDNSSVQTAGSSQASDFTNISYGSRSTWGEYDRDTGTPGHIDELTVLQACVFIEDAVEYRSIQHKLDKTSLLLYRLYYVRPVQWLLYLTIFVLHMLAFLETPSSLSLSSDLRLDNKRINLPCGVTESVEFTCLLLLTADLIIKCYVKGRSQVLQSRWLIAYGLVMLISILDWSVSVSLKCTEVVRVRRMLRPFFLLQNSSLMKKTVNCLWRTLPQVASVLLLLLLHLYFFTLFGMLLFPKQQHEHDLLPINSSSPGKLVKEDTEQALYFNNLLDSFLNLLVLLTTANNPDVTMPAYMANRFYALYFIIFLAIGLYCFMNMLTAVIYNQFRGYFQNSMQASLFRRRLAVRATYEVLRKRRVGYGFRSELETYGSNISAYHLHIVIDRAKIKKSHKVAINREIESTSGGLLSLQQFHEIFSVLESARCKKPKPVMRDISQPCLKKLQFVVSHKYFTYFGCFIAFANVICISIELGLEYDHLRQSTNTPLGILNLLFVMYYLIELFLKLWALGWRCYLSDGGNIFEGVITVILVIVQIIYLIKFGLPFSHKLPNPSSSRGLTLWDFVRIINMLIMLRLLHVVIYIKAMFLVASTLADLVKNLRPFAGVIVVIYYSYALLGMNLFQNKITFTNTTNESSIKMHKCGTYEQLEYWANNFDDFAAALVVLWDVMVVNNWHVFLHAYTKYVSKWAQIYFIVWWLISVVIALNIFTALVVQNFTMRWDREQQRLNHTSQHGASGLMDSINTEYFTVHDMFRDELQEPSEESLVLELRQHPHFSHVR